MEQNNLEELFDRIKEITKLEDIGCHLIENGRLKPVYKTQTDVLGIERWKTVHGENPVYIKDTFVLREVTEKKQPIFINNTKSDERSADAFFLFGVDSILIVPIIASNEVIGIICIVSIGSLHNFTNEEVEVCNKLVKQYI